MSDGKIKYYIQWIKYVSDVLKIVAKASDIIISDIRALEYPKG